MPAPESLRRTINIVEREPGFTAETFAMRQNVSGGQDMLLNDRRDEHCPGEGI